MAESGDSPYIAPHCPQCGAPLPGGGEEVTCAHCGTYLIRRPAASGSGETFVQGIRLRPFSCVDTQGIGCEAFRLLIPAGWTFSGGVQWLLNNPAMPAVIAFQVHSPTGTEAFEVLPNLSFTWSNNPMVQMTMPVGSLYFGSEVRPPMGAQQALREIVLPRFRRQMPGLRLVREEALPELAAQLGVGQTSGGMTHAEAAKVRITYQQGATTMEEEVFAVVEVTRFLLPMMFGYSENFFWLLEYLCGFRAPAGRLDGLAGLFRAIAHSFRLNPQWYGRYMQVSQFLVQNQIQQIHNIGQLSRIIHQTHEEISDSLMASYYERQGIMDRLSSSWSQAIRGVDEYHDPFRGSGMELPGGYRHAWANALGEYILTDDPTFNPNIGSNLTWEALERR